MTGPAVRVIKPFDERSRQLMLRLLLLLLGEIERSRIWSSSSSSMEMAAS